MNPPETDCLSNYDYGPFIQINSSSGRIGRMIWCNQRQLTLEAFDRNNNLISRDTTELHGSFALISLMGDWYAWMLGD